MISWKKRLRQLAIATGLIGALTGTAYAAQFAPRQFNTQQTHYMRFEVDFNSCTLVAGTPDTCSFKVGAVPYNAFLARLYFHVVTVFNSGTMDQIGLATSAGGNNVMARTNVHTGVSQSVSTVTTGFAIGSSAVGAEAVQTGSDGGFEIWAVYNSDTTPPTTGKAIFVLEYIAPNDGTCTTTPMGTTALEC